MVAAIILFGAPFFIAAIPGLVALFARRWIFGGILLLGACIAIALPEYLDSLRIHALVAKGVVADDLGFLFLPWLYGIPYALLSGMALAAFTEFDRSQ
ncbi:MAG: hypothetical protein QM759_14470 [Terricaulis sp.]